MGGRWIVALVALAAGPAYAGSGPWTLGRGDQSVFLGVEAQRLTQLSAVLPDGRDTIPVGEGLSTFGLKAIGSYGIARRVEIEGTVPWYQVQANRTDAELCGALGLQACARTRSLGVLEGRVKVQLADELAGAPVSVAAGAQARFGGLTARHRARLTNVGEGTTDVGGFLSVGRIGALGGSGGYWTAFVDMGGLYRFPNTRSFGPDDLGVPAPELWALSNVLIAPNGTIALGPEVVASWRPGGLDFYEVDLTDIDRFSALRVFTARGGAKVLVRDERNTTFVVSFLHTFAAVNNPLDVWIVNVGIGLNNPFTRAGGREE